MLLWFFFFKQKTAYEMRISDWSSDVCSSDLIYLNVAETGIGTYGVEAGARRYFRHGADRLTPSEAIADPPPLLSVLGDPGLLNRSCIAMVGARNASVAGQRFAQKMAADLGGNGFVVVSGPARGSAAAAHTGAPETGTVAVAAGGGDVVSPADKRALRAWHVGEDREDGGS